MAVNYDDKRFQQVESDKQQALTEVEKNYSGMIDQSDGFYQEQIEASKQWADKQTQLQQEQTDFTVEKIEQQKDQAQKDYIKEQSGAYVDWQKQSNQYGANAEQMAQNGMTNTGFSETSQVGMYNQYQNRVMAAREIMSQAMLNYDNGIREAQLQNNSVLAEIHFQALQQQLTLALDGFQYKNNLILEQTNKKLEVDQMYHQRWQDVLAQINHEKSMEEQIRQFNEEIARLKANDAKAHEMEIKKLEHQKAQLAEEKRQFDAQMAYQKEQAAKSSGSGAISKSSGSGSNTSSSSGNINKSTSTTGSSNRGGGGGKFGENNLTDAYDYFNKMIAAGKNKNQVLSEIAIAEKNGVLTKKEASQLRAIFNPRGNEY